MGHLLTAFAGLTIAAFSSVAGADPLARGQEVAAAFLTGDPGDIWLSMTPDLQAAFGSVDGLIAVREELLATFGTEDQILAESTVRQGAYDVYQRVADWTGSPTPVQVIISFDQDEQIAGFFVRPQPVAAPSPDLEYQTKADLRLPFDGAWHVYWGGRTIEDNYHAVDPGQRFALDLVVMRDGQSQSGDPLVLANYHCWDRAILAAATGIVARVVDGLVDQPIGSADQANPAGNHVVLDLGNDEYAFLAHLRRASIAVALGDRVVAGTMIGRCGNSGNSSEPHLHFHLQSTPQLGTGRGLPAQFLSYLADENPIERGEPVRGQVIQPRQ